MTRFTPLWQQAGSYPANYDRALLATLWPAPAAVGAAAGAVTNTMNVSIPPGSLAVPLQSGQHTALCRWDAAEVVSSTAAPAAGNSRIDTVIAQVRDPVLDSGVNNDFIFLVLAGTPAVSNPVAPTVPANAAPVCTYTVAGGIANLNGVTITDARRGIGTTPVFATAAERDAVLGTSPPDGTTCITTTDRKRWLRLAGAWTWDGPQGEIARIERSSSAGPASGAAAAISGLSFSYTLPTPRLVRVEAYVRHFTFGAAAAYGNIELRDETNAVLVDGLTFGAAVSGGAVIGPSMKLDRTVNLAAGTHSLTLWMTAILGGTMTAVATATSPMWIAASDARVP